MSSGVLAVFAAAVIFSTAGAAIKLLTLTGWQIVCLRSGLAALVLLALFPSARRRWTRRDLLAAIPFTGTVTSFALATKLTTAADAIFLQSTAPLYLAVMGPWLLREPLRRGELATMGVMLLGLALLAFADAPASATAPFPALGRAIAILSGVFWAFTVASLRWLGRGSEDGGLPGATMVAGNLFAALLALPLALPLPAMSTTDLATMTWLGVVQIPVAYVCLGFGLQRIPALTVSLLMLVEPVLNPLWVWLLHGETPGAGTLAGGAIVIAATAWLARGAARQPAIDRADAAA